MEKYGGSTEDIAQVTSDIAKSKKGKSSKVKGSNYERTVKGMLKDALGIELQRTPLSGGFAKNKDINSVKGDLNTLDDKIKFRLHVECKDQRNWNIKEWWRQTQGECPKGKIPILFMHQGQEIVAGTRVGISEHFVLLRTEDFLELVEKGKVVKTEESK